MDIGAITQQMFILLILIALGYAAAKARVIDETANNRLSRLVLYITMPAMVLASVMTGERIVSGAELAQLWLCVGFFYVFLFLVSLVLPRILRVPGEDRGIYRFMCIFANVGFMGFPVTAAIFGESAVFLAAVFQMGFSVLIYTLGIYLISGGPKKQFNWKSLLQPGILAAIAAVLLYALDIHVPALISQPVTLVGNITTPASMLTIGASLAMIPLKKVFKDVRVYLFTAIRLLAVPIVVFYVLQLFIESRLLLGISVVMASMPVAAMTTMMASEYNGNIELASKSIFISIILSIFSVPLLMWFFFG